ncbi:MAG: Ig-like domain-containing protein [Calditrichaceae bacterium]|nr:Ig-like domain-containing protein [Calditrichaceae bacterium]
MNKVCFLISLLTGFLWFTTCSENNPVKTEDQTGYTASVGAEGGVVTDPAGASVIIPAGALDTVQDISIFTYADAAALNSHTVNSPFSGGADFGPDGLTFNKPVTITITAAGLTDGLEYAVFVFDQENQKWIQHDSCGTAGTGGTSLTFKTTHFSAYAASLIPGQSSLSSIGDQLIAGGVPATVFNSFMDQFSQTYGLGKKMKSGDQCYEITGVFFDLQGIMNENEFEHTQLIGSDTDFDLTSHLSYFYDCAAQIGESELQLVYEISVTIYWSETEPDFQLTASKNHLEPDQNATITALLKCGAEPVSGHTVNFYLSGSGSLSSGSAVTNISGEAQITYTAGEEGTATITASPECCDGIEDEVTIVVGEEGEDRIYHVIINAEYTNLSHYNDQWYIQSNLSFFNAQFEFDIPWRAEFAYFDDHIYEFGNDEEAHEPAIEVSYSCSYGDLDVTGEDCPAEDQNLHSQSSLPLTADVLIIPETREFGFYINSGWFKDNNGVFEFFYFINYDVFTYYGGECEEEITLKYYGINHVGFEFDYFNTEPAGFSINRKLEDGYSETGNAFAYNWTGNGTATITVTLKE